MTSSVCCLTDPEQGLQVWKREFALGDCSSGSCSPASSRSPPLVASSITELLGTATSTAIDVIYVHGNRMTHREAIERGYWIRETLRRRSPQGAPVRWIIWSWPSEKESILLKDAHIKEGRADAQSHYLSWMLRRLGTEERPLNLIGYSFGSRVITGALHIAAGGNLGQNGLGDPPVIGLRARVGLLAPAMESDWLAPHRCHGLAGWNIESIMVFTNSADPVLIGFFLSDPRKSTSAMGVRGITDRPYNRQGEPVSIKHCDCRSAVGRHHDETRYYAESCGAARCVAQMIWGQKD